MVGRILTFSGAGLVASGIGVGLYARSKYKGQIGPGKNCTDESPPVCNAEGSRITNDARTIGTFGTIIGVAGVALAGVGAYLWYTDLARTTERNVAIVPTLAPDSAGVTAIGRF